jgi:hypothetical protein
MRRRSSQEIGEEAQLESAGHQPRDHRRFLPASVVRGARRYVIAASRLDEMLHHFVVENCTTLFRPTIVRFALVQRPMRLSKPGCFLLGEPRVSTRRGLPDPVSLMSSTRKSVDGSL